MNLFFLDRDFEKSAEFHCDKHCVKMLLEYSQMMSTAHQLLDQNPRPEIYKTAYANHPMTVWVRSSDEHYEHTYLLWSALHDEYQKRYQKTHKSFLRLCEPLGFQPDSIPQEGWTDPPQCMPEQYHSDDPVEAYRNYYIGDKAYFARWKFTQEPEWWNDKS